ncbi:MAG: hypothetical protein EXR69_05310 [Myxococcales bacterium]|nr:hypothetical protein [Myxococcales bacterium]
MNWADSAGRVVLEACTPHVEDHAILLGYSAIVDTLAPQVARITVVDETCEIPLPAGARYHRGPIDQPPELGAASMVLAHWTWRTLPVARQRALAQRLGQGLRERALLVIGDIIWSFPPASIDEPEQFGDRLEHAPTADILTAMLRDTGFLPDLHRFGPAVGVMIALRANR